MRAGSLRHRCILQREESTPRPGAGRNVAWVDVRELWAEVTLPTGRTQMVADRLESQVTAEIIVRYKRDISAGMRMFHKTTGVTYKVEAALPDNQLDLLRLLCSSVNNP